MRRFLFLISITVGIAGAAHCQNADTLLRADTIRNKFLPTGIRIGTDLITSIKSARQANFDGYEVNADIDFYKYLLALDYGSWGRDYSSDTLSYSNDGTYWRAGIDVNFLTRDPDRNVFLIGFRYARANYSEAMYTSFVDPVWGPVEQNLSNADLQARWFELTTGLKVKIWKIIWLGYTARMKYGLKTNDGSRELLTHDVPGYGRTDKDTYWGFNYQLMLRIPIRKADPILPAKKKK